MLRFARGRQGPGLEIGDVLRGDLLNGHTREAFLRHRYAGSNGCKAGYLRTYPPYLTLSTSKRRQRGVSDLKRCQWKKIDMETELPIGAVRRHWRGCDIADARTCAGRGNFPEALLCS